MRRQGAGVTRGRLGSRVATIWVLHVGRLTLPGTQLPNVGSSPSPPLSAAGAAPGR